MHYTSDVLVLTRRMDLSQKCRPADALCETCLNFTLKIYIPRYIAPAMPWRAHASVERPYCRLGRDGVRVVWLRKVFLGASFGARACTMLDHASDTFF